MKTTSIAMTALAVAVGLIGCGKEEPKPAPAPAKAEAPKPDPLKIGFIYVGPTGDAGWTFAHDNARKEVEKEFGDKVKTSFVESVPEGPDAERVIIIMGSGAETVHETVEVLQGRGEKVGVLKVRLYRPFPGEQLLAALPKINDFTFGLSAAYTSAPASSVVLPK